jgi:hypothetical protein
LGYYYTIFERNVFYELYLQYLPNRQPGDGIGNVCAARQAVTGVQSLARVAGQGGVTRELMHGKYVLVLGLQVVDHA